MAGAYMCNYLYVKRLSWIYTKPQLALVAPCQSKVKTFVRKFKPNVWTKHDWSVFESPKRYFQVLLFCFFGVGVDVMNFFLKYILWIPANHKILMVRLFIWAFGSIATAKEYYEFITNKNCKRVGPWVWLSSFALAIELSIAVKFGMPMFTQPFP